MEQLATSACTRSHVPFFRPKLGAYDTACGSANSDILVLGTWTGTWLLPKKAMP